MSMMDLPTFMVTSYNGYNFPSNVETIAFQLVPQYDSARRTVTFVDVHLGLRWYYVCGAAVQGPVTVPGIVVVPLNSKDMVARLSAPAGVLKYTGRGLDEILGPSGTPREIDYGPQPGDLTLEPFGGLVMRATWRVKLSLPVCSDAVFKGVREWNYSVGFDIDKNGNTTITTDGFIKIAANRSGTGDRSVVDSADAFRESVTPPFRDGFRRLAQTYNLSEAKDKLKYVCVDQQIGPNAPGPGLTDARASQSITSEGPARLFTWIHTITGDYTVAAGQSVQRAWDAFFNKVKDSLSVIRTIPGVGIIPHTFYSVRSGHVRAKSTSSFANVLSSCESYFSTSSRPDGVVASGAEL